MVVFFTLCVWLIIASNQNILASFSIRNMNFKYKVSKLLVLPPRVVNRRIVVLRIWTMNQNSKKALIESKYSILLKKPGLLGSLSINNILHDQLSMNKKEVCQQYEQTTTVAAYIYKQDCMTINLCIFQYFYSHATQHRRIKNRWLG